MKKNMIKKILILLIFLTSSHSLSKDLKYQANNNLPLEFIYLIKSYQKYDLTNEEKKSFKYLLYFYDNSFLKLSKAEYFQLIKSQIYKNIINFFPISNKEGSSKDLKEIKEKLKEKLREEGNDHFKRWLISALIRDINLVAKSKSLNKGGIYYSLFYNWNNLFYDSLPQEVNRTLKNLSKRILSNLKYRLNDFLLISKNISLKESKEKDPKKMFFFKVEKETTLKGEDKPEPKSESGSKILKILAPINEESLILPGTIRIEDEWTPKDEKENININPPKPDPNYVKPKKLPIPINDW